MTAIFRWLGAEAEAAESAGVERDEQLTSKLRPASKLNHTNECGKNERRVIGQVPDKIAKRTKALSLTTQAGRAKIILVVNDR